MKMPSAQARTGERLGRPEALLRQLGHVLQPAVGTEETGDVVDARAEVVDRERVAERRLRVVAVRRVRKARPVELAARVVLVGRERRPAVFVQEEYALAVDVALVGLERRL